MGTRLRDTARDSLARQIQRIGATADLERVAPQWSKRSEDKHGTDKIRVARIDVVATVLFGPDTVKPVSFELGGRDHRRSACSKG